MMMMIIIMLITTTGLYSPQRTSAYHFHFSIDRGEISTGHFRYDV